MSLLIKNNYFGKIYCQKLNWKIDNLSELLKA